MMHIRVHAVRDSLVIFEDDDAYARAFCSKSTCSLQTIPAQVYSLIEASL